MNIPVWLGERLAGQAVVEPPDGAGRGLGSAAVLRDGLVIGCKIRPVELFTVRRGDLDCGLAKGMAVHAACWRRPVFFAAQEEVGGEEQFGAVGR